MPTSTLIPPSLRRPRSTWPIADQVEAARARSAPEAAGAATDESYPEWFRRTLPPSYGYPPHIAYLCDRVQDLVDGTVQRLCVSLPPGHGKSETITRRLPIYWAERNPADVIVQTGYAQRFAEKHLSYPTRELAREQGVLSSNATALDEWEFSNGARFVTRGVGSAPTGVNPISLLICDDPIKDAAEARSAIVRENVWDWWKVSIVQRFWPRTRALIIATRWHEDDLIGRLKEQEAALPEAQRTWTFVNLPALAGDDDPLGRAPGAALWPEEKNAAFLASLRDVEMGVRDFEAVFQGNPTPREGTTFKVGKLRYCDAADVPALEAVCRAWDLAATEGAGDYTAGVKMGRGTDGLTYVLDTVRGQWDAATRNARMRETAALDGPSVRVRIPQDPGQAGKEQAAALTRMLAGVPVKALPVSGDKATRADPFASQINAGGPDAPGNVVLVRGAWNSAFVEELRAFPNGAHDDQVDASADAFNEIAFARSEAPRSVVSRPLTYRR